VRSLLAVTFLRCCFLLCKMRMIVFNYFIAAQNIFIKATGKLRTPEILPVE